MERAQKLSNLYIGALLLVFLPAVGPAGYGGITGFKLGLLAALTGAYLVLLGALWVKNGCPAPGKPDLWDGLLLGYGGLTLLSALVNGLPLLGAARREGAASILLYLAAALALRHLARPGRWLYHLAGAAMTAWSGVALVQLAGGNPLGLYPAGMGWADRGVRYGGAYIGTTGNTDLGGALVCLAIPALLAGLLDKKLRGRWWLLLPLAMTAAVTARMEVRAALVGLALGLPFALLLLLPLSAKARKRSLLGLLALLLGALLLIFCFDLGGTLGEAHDLLRGQAQDAAGSGRVFIWRSCLPLVWEHPLLGLGPDGLGRRGIYFERQDPDNHRVIRALIDTAHNEYLNVAVQQGLPALACFLGLLFVSFRRALGRPQNRPAAAALLCWGVQACFGFSMCITAPFFWLALALAAQKEGVTAPKSAE